MTTKISTWSEKLKQSGWSDQNKNWFVDITSVGNKFSKYDLWRAECKFRWFIESHGKSIKEVVEAREQVLNYERYAAAGGDMRNAPVPEIHGAHFLARLYGYALEEVARQLYKVTDDAAISVDGILTPEGEGESRWIAGDGCGQAIPLPRIETKLVFINDDKKSYLRSIGRD